MNLYVRALRCLARREYSRLELEKKLVDHAQSPEEIQQILDRLEQEKLLSDERAAEQIAYARSRRYGSLRICYELKNKGIEESLIETTLEKLKSAEFSNAQALWSRKFGISPTTPAERGKQTRYLAGRGFSFEVIHQVLSAAQEAES